MKAVGGSVELPLDYNENNVIRGLSLLRAMKQSDVTMLVFRSSATVNGTPPFLPFTETHPITPTSPYGRIKLLIEEMLRDLFCGRA